MGVGYEENLGGITAFGGFVANAIAISSCMCILFAEMLDSSIWNRGNENASIVPYVSDIICLPDFHIMCLTVWIAEAKVVASTRC